MRTSAALGDLFGDRMDHGDVVVNGRFTDRDRAWIRVGLLRRFIEGSTRDDHPDDVRDAATELAQIVAALLAEQEVTR